MTNADKWKAFDLAEWSLDILISCCSEQIYCEEKKSLPSSEKIRGLMERRSALDTERDALSVEDQDNISRVIQTYTSEAKSAMERARANDASH